VVGNDDQSNDLPQPPWETQNAESDPFQAGLAGGLSVPSGQLGVSQPQSVQITQPGHQISQSQPVLTGQLGGMQLRPGQAQQSHPVQNTQYGGMYPPVQGNQPGGMYLQQMAGDFYQQQMYSGQMAGYGYSQQPGSYYVPNSTYAYSSANELSQRMNGLSVQDNSFYGVPASSSLQQRNRPSRPEDSLFSDLVNIAKSKPSKTGI
jgi:hypothetical protein